MTKTRFGTDYTAIFTFCVLTRKYMNVRNSDIPKKVPDAFGGLATIADGNIGKWGIY